MHLGLVLAVIVIAIALLPTALTIVGSARVGLVSVLRPLFILFAAAYVVTVAAGLVESGLEYPRFGLVVVLLAITVGAYTYSRIHGQDVLPALGRIRRWHRRSASATAGIPADDHRDATHATSGLSMDTVRTGDYVQLAGSPGTRGRVIAKRKDTVWVKWYDALGAELGIVTPERSEQLRKLPQNE
jgi:hypothetical protein